jgi:hypothetical protein
MALLSRNGGGPIASLALRNQSYRLTFCYHGKRSTFTMGEVSEREAENSSAAVDQTLLRLRQGLLTLPPDADLVEFVKHGGRVPQPEPPRPEPITLASFRDRYLKAQTGPQEENSLATVWMRFGHFAATFGERFSIQRLRTAKLQEHIDRRKGKKKLSPVTLKKEMATLRAAWNWGSHLGLVVGKANANAPAEFAVIADLLADSAVASGDIGRLKGWWFYRMLFGPDSLAGKYGVGSSSGRPCSGPDRTRSRGFLAEGTGRQPTHAVVPRATPNSRHLTRSLPSPGAPTPGNPAGSEPR